MTILSDSEKMQAVSDIRAMIEAGGTTARILRPAKAGLDSFFGAHEAAEVEIAAAIACELQDLPPEEVQQTGHDAALHVLPDVDVAEGDFTEVNGVRYRVTDRVEHNLFGVVTHLELRLEREYKDHG